MEYSKHNLPFSLQGRRALIPGGGSGIGLGIARCMAAAGAEVVLAGRRAEPLEAAVAEIGELASSVVFDITDLAAIPDFVSDVESRFGAVDFMIHNAGIHLKKPSVEVTDSEFAAVQAVHVNATFAMSREFGARMCQRGRGHILFISSMSALIGLTQVAAYSAAKSAHLGMTRSLSGEFASKGVRVNAIAPGWIHSEMMHKAVNADPERKAKILGRTQIGDFGDAEDIGWAAVYLCSDAAKFVTGVCLPVDGGASIGF